MAGYLDLNGISTRTPEPSADPVLPKGMNVK
jgi:hypothetical protein